MSDEKYAPSAEMAANAHIDAAKYAEMYSHSVSDPAAFWGEQGKRLDWMKPYTKVKNTSFEYPNVSIQWYEDGELNVAANCVDRHAEKTPDKTAIIWESDDPTVDKHISYAELKREVSRLGNALIDLGIGKGDRVILYMPMIPEAAYAMLACARIGAVHSVVFGGFSPDALADRVKDCGAKLVITADEAPRGGRNTPLKDNCDAAMRSAATRCAFSWSSARAARWRGTRRGYLVSRRGRWLSDECPPVAMNAEDPLFILYTSGSTGQPKGVLHTSGGYLVYASMTQELVFDYHDKDVFWCTADVVGSRGTAISFTVRWRTARQR